MFAVGLFAIWVQRYEKEVKDEKTLMFF